jgi:hypothetical protein
MSVVAGLITCRIEGDAVYPRIAIQLAPPLFGRIFHKSVGIEYRDRPRKSRKQASEGFFAARLGCDAIKSGGVLGQVWKTVV